MRIGKEHINLRCAEWPSSDLTHCSFSCTPLKTHRSDETKNLVASSLESDVD